MTEATNKCEALGEWYLGFYNGEGIPSLAASKTTMRGADRAFRGYLHIPPKQSKFGIRRLMQAQLNAASGSERSHRYQSEAGGR
ncbi:MAG: hypothetical protein ACYDBJ_03190, partial [Aggregatilineales bacterium]